MSPRAKGNILFAVVVGISLVVIWFGSGGHTSPSLALEPSATVEGEVLAIETVRENRTPDRREAVVRLPSGETVRAYVPAACVVFAGQMAKLSRYGSVGGHFYMVSESSEPKAK